MKQKIKLLSTVIILTIIFAGRSVSGANEALLKQGIESAYNFNLDYAKSVLLSLAKSDEKDPRAYYYLSQIHLWLYLGSADADDLNSMTKYSDLCIEKLKNWTPLHDKSGAVVNSYLGNIYMQKAIALGKAGQYLEMVNVSQKSYGYLSASIKADPENYDAYLGLGLFKFALSRIPSSINYMINIAGFKTSLDEAYNYVKIASQKSTYTKTEAQYYLGELSREFLFNYPESIKIFEGLRARYPNNIMFSYSLGVSYIKGHKLEAGRRIIEPLSNTHSKEFQQLKAYSYMLLGDIKFYQNSFSAAIPQYEKFLNFTKIKDYTGIAHFRMGVAYHFLKNETKSKAHFVSASTGNTSLDEDAFANSKGLAYTKKYPGDNEFKIFKFANMIAAGGYHKAVDSLVSLLGKTAGEDLSPLVKYYLSEAYLGLKDYKQAIQYAQEVIVAKKVTEDWIKPFSHYNAAVGYYKTGEIESGKNMISKSEQYSDFVFASQLKNKVEALRFVVEKTSKK